MRKLIQGMEKFLDNFTVLLLLVMVVLVALQVIFRFVGFAAPWTEEMARFTFVYITFFGSVLALKEGSHIVIEILVNRLPQGLRRVFGIVFNALIAGFLVLVIMGSRITLEVNKEVSAASLPWFKMTYVYISVLIASILMLGYVLSQIWRLIFPTSDNNQVRGG